MTFTLALAAGRAELWILVAAASAAHVLIRRHVGRDATHISTVVA